ncbi:50S ribosomal protein L19 [Candidatus Peregrinibacteria bacterium]|nr:50S ribosomal protein L19 [Candidatus Peregrinibacteria bacterium]
MPSAILHRQAAAYVKKLPEIAPGYTVRVHERIKEGEKERVQIFEGLVIGVHRGHSATDATFTVRRIASGIGVERIFSIHSPMVEKVDVRKVARVRRAKLSFLRGRRGKSARLSERFTSADEFAIAVQASEKEEASVSAEESVSSEQKSREDHLRRYTRSMLLLLVGNYGVGNLGDEALKDYFLSRFPEVDWTVVSAHPQGEHDVPRLPLGFRSFFATPWPRTLKALWSCDGVVFGGGALFTESESRFAVVLWWSHAAFAMAFRRPILLAFQGIGPFSTRLGRWMTRFVLRRARFISVRDPLSVRRVCHLCPGIPVTESFDPVFAVSRALVPRSIRSPRSLALIPRATISASFEKRVRDLLRQGDVTSVRILSLQPDDLRESETCRMLATKFSADVVPIRSLADLISAIEESRLVLSQRYHGAIAALALRVPYLIVEQTDGDKFASLRPWSGKIVDHQTIAELQRRVDEGERGLREALVALGRLKNSSDHPSIRAAAMSG